MRTLNALLRLAECNLDGLRQFIGAIIAERTDLTQAALADKTDKAIIWLTLVAGFSMVRRISYAVGHHELMPTYERVLASTDTLACRIIDIAIKLEYGSVPENELRDIKQWAHKNLYAYPSPASWSPISCICTRPEFPSSKPSRRCGTSGFPSPGPAESGQEGVTTRLSWRAAQARPPLGSADRRPGRPCDMLMPLEAEGRTGVRSQESEGQVPGAKPEFRIQKPGVRMKSAYLLLSAFCLLRTADCRTPPTGKWGKSSCLCLDKPKKIG